MPVYVSFSDESGSGDGKGIFLVAGYLAKHTDWPHFSRCWNEQIIQSPPPIPYLHMTDIRSDAWRSKHGISREQGTDKIRLAVNLIDRCEFLEPFIGSVDERHYSEIKNLFTAEGIKLQKHGGLADYPAFAAYAHSILNDIASRDPEVTKVNFNISRKKHIDRYIRNDLRDELIATLSTTNAKLSGLVGDIVPLSMEEHLPLQAADLLCWHLQRTYAATFDDEDLENLKIFQKRQICGFEMNSVHLTAMAQSVILKFRREKQYGTDADRFANSVSQILGISREAIAAEMERQDKFLKRNRKQSKKSGASRKAGDRS